MYLYVSVYELTKEFVQFLMISYQQVNWTVNELKLISGPLSDN